MYAECRIKMTADTPRYKYVIIAVGECDLDPAQVFITVPDTEALDRLFSNGKDVGMAGFAIHHYKLLNDKSDTNPYIRMSSDYWEEHYKPIMENGSPKSIDYDEAHAIACDETRKACLWTLVQAENLFVITSGWHFVNRMDYHLTEIPLEGDHDVEVYDEPDFNMVDDVNGGYSTLILKGHGLKIGRHDGEVENFPELIRAFAKEHGIELSEPDDDDDEEISIDDLLYEFNENTIGYEIELY